jgi:hypothetical protein
MAPHLRSVLNDGNHSIRASSAAEREKALETAGISLLLVHVCSRGGRPPR